MGLPLGPVDHAQALGALRGQTGRWRLRLRRRRKLPEVLKFLVANRDMYEIVQNFGDVARRQNYLMAEEQSPLDHDPFNLCRDFVDQDAIDVSDMDVRLSAPDVRSMLDLSLETAFVQCFLGDWYAPGAHCPAQ